MKNKYAFMYTYYSSLSICFNKVTHFWNDSSKICATDLKRKKLAAMQEIFKEKKLNKICLFGTPVNFHFTYTFRKETYSIKNCNL